MKTSKQVLINQYFLVHIFLPLIIGCGIYVLLRKSSVFYIENWIPYNLPNIKIVEFIKYNLPDGLWLGIKLLISTV